MNPALPNFMGGILYCVALLPGGFLWAWLRGRGGEVGKRLAATAP